MKERATIIILRLKLL